MIYQSLFDRNFSFFKKIFLNTIFYREFFIKFEKFQISESSVFALICWVVILIFISNFAFKWNAREH